MAHKPDKKIEKEQQIPNESKLGTNQQQDKKSQPKEPQEITLKTDEYNYLKQEAQSAKEYHDRLLRLQAEFDNAKKRLEKEKLEFIKYANEGIIIELLSVLDDLERSVEAAQTKHEDPEAFLKGIEMILSHLYEMLKKNNVRPIEAKGKIFDPHFHEALMQIESDEYPENTIVEELQKGYLLGDRVIRTTKAKVATAKDADKKSADGADKKSA